MLHKKEPFVTRTAAVEHYSLPPSQKGPLVVRTLKIKPKSDGMMKGMLKNGEKEGLFSLYAP